MMYSKFDRLLSFASVHHAIRAEKLLHAAAIITQALPTPREIDISCGQCLLFMALDQQRVVALLDEHQIECSRLFKCSRSNRVYEEIERK